MNGERYTLDTNVLIYAVDRDAGKKHEQAMDLIQNSVTADCVLTLQSLSEFYHATTRKGKMPQKEAHGQVQDWITLFPVQAASVHTLNKAIIAVEDHSLSFWCYAPDYFGGNSINYPTLLNGYFSNKTLN
jgi:predicted nucleic acid-binding protein